MRTRTLLLLLVGLLPACSSSSAPPAPPPVDVSQGLTELGEVYKYRGAEKQPAPAKAGDLAENEAALQNAWPAIQDGRIVVAWKVGYSSSSAEVLAYEKDAAANGGNVLLRNGTVKKMTAAEFAAAPKAR